MRRLGQVPALDGLRGIAVLLVVISHTTVLTKPNGASVMDMLEGGFIGVDIFFVLSGFLITALLLSEQGAHGDVRFGSFYARRALRLLPALGVMLAVYVAYSLLAGDPREPMVDTVGLGIGYVSNWQSAWSPGTVAPGIGHLWSLSIEEQFYLIWPWILIGLLGAKRSARTVGWVLVALIVLVAVHRSVMWLSIPADLPAVARIGRNSRVFFGTDTRVDELLIGALLASLWVRRATPTRGFALAGWVGSAIIALMAVSADGGQTFMYVAGFDLIAVATALVIFAAMGGGWSGSQALEWTPLRAVGRVSYGIYLWHLVVFYVVSKQFHDDPKLLRILLGYSITAVVVLASWRFVEQPALRAKRRMERREDVGALV